MLERLAKTADLPPLMIHSFGGSLETMLRLVRLGCWISFSARLIDRKRHALHQVFCETPTDRILLETDAPDQLPATLRNSGDALYNEPANIADFYRQAARLRCMSFDDFTQQIWNNGEIYADSLLPR
jgi:TatD DNase family protein